jgi:hypothetical protein
MRQAVYQWKMDNTEHPPSSVHACLSQSPAHSPPQLDKMTSMHVLRLHALEITWQQKIAPPSFESFLSHRNRFNLPTTALVDMGLNSIDSLWLAGLQFLRAVI